MCDVLPWTPETEKSLGFTELLNDLPGSITFSGHDEFTFESCPTFRKLARRPSGATRPASPQPASVYVRNSDKIDFMREVLTERGVEVGKVERLPSIFCGAKNLFQNVTMKVDLPHVPARSTENGSQTIETNV